jgi:three-Cys-motif partner protein
MNVGEYVSERVELLQRDADEFYEIGDEVSNDFDSWTALKLILHLGAIEMYTTVHRSQGTGDIFYIDALAGSGISKYDESSFFKGSPLIAAEAAKMPFSKMFFIERNERCRNALRDRLTYAFDQPAYTEPDEWEVMGGDVNNQIGDVIDEIWKMSDFDTKFNYYCFIDNEGLNANWSVIDSLTPRPYGDLLINIPTTVMGMSARKGSINALNQFFPDDISREALGSTSRSRLKRMYCDEVADSGRSVQERTHIDTDDAGSYCYDLLYATRDIEGGNDYMEVIEYLREGIERIHSGHVDDIISVIEDQQEQLSLAFPDEDVEKRVPGFETETGVLDHPNEGKQAGLDDFE